MRGIQNDQVFVGLPDSEDLHPRVIEFQKFIRGWIDEDEEIISFLMHPKSGESLILGTPTNPQHLVACIEYLNHLLNRMKGEAPQPPDIEN